MTHKEIIKENRLYVVKICIHYFRKYIRLKTIYMFFMFLFVNDLIVCIGRFILLSSRVVHTHFINFARSVLHLFTFWVTRVAVQSSYLNIHIFWNIPSKIFYIRTNNSSGSVYIHTHPYIWNWAILMIRRNFENVVNSQNIDNI